MKVHSIFYILLGFFFLHGANPVYGQENLDIHEPDTVQMVRTQVLEAQQDGQNYILTLEIESGLYAGQVLELPYMQEHPGSSIIILPGDKMLVQLESNNGSISNAYISSYIRDQKLLELAAAFAIILIIIGGKKGFKSILSLIISGIVIYFIMLPMFFQGYDPIITTIIISTVVSILSLIIISGRNTKTLAAIIGTTGGVMIAGVLAIIVGSAAQLTGLSDEEMQSLLFIPQQISYDYSGILFSGMIIGALGAVMDVGMSIASSIEEIKQANSSLGTMALIRAGMNVGRDIMGTMSNTLIFAYTGGAIPLMLVFMAYHTPLSRVVNLEMIATEIVRALTGSIGLIIAVPITSIAAGTLFGRYRSDYYR